MRTVAEICDALGRRNLAKRLGVGETAISNAVVAGRFPASWYDVVESECGRHGIACDRSLFAFKRDKGAFDTPDTDRGAAA